MSDNKKTEQTAKEVFEAAKKDAKNPLDGWMSTAAGLLGAWAFRKGNDLVEKEVEKIYASELGPGCVIRVGHVNIMVVGVRLVELWERESSKLKRYVQVAGAPTVNRGVDWEWNSKEITWNSPFLQFRELQQIYLVRESPYADSTLQSFAGRDERLNSERYKEGVDIGERVGKEKGYERCFEDVKKVLSHRIDRIGSPTNDTETVQVSTLKNVLAWFDSSIEFSKLVADSDADDEEEKARSQLFREKDV